MSLTPSQAALAGLGMGLQLATNTMNVTARNLAASLLPALHSPNTTISTGVLYLLGNLTGHATNTTTAEKTLEAYQYLPYTGMGWLAVANIVMPSIAFVAVVLRLYSRAVFTGKIRGDDWAVVVAMGLCLYQCAYFAYLIPHGFGSHQWDVSFSDIRLNLKLAFFGGLCYLISRNLIKISFCIFYLSLSVQRTFLYAVYAALSFLVMWTIINVVLFCLICHPINYWDHLTSMKCINKDAAYLADCVITIYTDVLILSLPMFVVWRLKLKLRERLVVIALFAIGFFTTIVTGIRMIVVKHYGDNSDITASSPLVTFYVMLEQNLGLFIACVPALRNLFIRYAPRILGYKPNNVHVVIVGGGEGGDGSTGSVSTKTKIDYDEIIRRYAIPKVGEEDHGIACTRLENVTTASTMAMEDCEVEKGVGKKDDHVVPVHVRRISSVGELERMWSGESSKGFEA